MTNELTEIFEHVYYRCMLKDLFEGILKSTDNKTSNAESNNVESSNGVAELSGLVDLLTLFADTVTHKTEGVKCAYDRTMEEEKAYLDSIILEIHNKLTVLANSTLLVVSQNIFDQIEDLLKNALEQLYRIISENIISNNEYIDIVFECYNSLNRFLQQVYRQLRDMALLAVITHKNGAPLQENDFCFTYYQNLYDIHILEKIAKNNKIRALNNLALHKK